MTKSTKTEVKMKYNLFICGTRALQLSELKEEYKSDKRTLISKRKLRADVVAIKPIQSANKTGRQSSGQHQKMIKL